jgi:hypothetical protein
MANFLMIAVSATRKLQRAALTPISGHESLGGYTSKTSAAETQAPVAPAQALGRGRRPCGHLAVWLIVRAALFAPRQQQDEIGRAARRGKKRGTGWSAWIGSDDRWHPDKLAHQALVIAGILHDRFSLYRWPYRRAAPRGH